MKHDRAAPVIRKPAVAGYYYPADPRALGEQLDAFTRVAAVPAPAHGMVVPHGSYRHSGAIAGAVFARVAIPRRCIVLGPSHTDTWLPWSLLMDGAYRTPLGDVPIDVQGAAALRARCPFLEPDSLGQRGEHAIETVVPFLQRRGPADLAIIPLVIGSDDADQFARVSEALAQVVRMYEEPVLLIASSDLSHYQAEADGAEQDRALLELIGALDGVGLIRYIQDRRVIMCGYDAVACVLEAAKALGATRATLAGYGTSVAAGGDPGSVTGYAGIVIT